MNIARHLSGKLGPTAAFVGLGVVLFAAAMVAPLDYDEELYVAGAYFARSLSVYRDFISLQPPLYTWILSAVFDLIGDWYLLSARVVTWAFALAACALLYSLLVSFGAGRVGAFALIIGFATSPFTQGPLVETRNDVMPLLFFVAALRLCLGADGEVSRDVLRALLGGFFAALAAATKYTYAFAAPILAVALFYDEYVQRDTSRGFAAPRTGSFLAGALLGLLPLIYPLAVHRERFILETLRFHLTAGFDWYQSQGFGEYVSFEHKVRWLRYQTMLRGNASILIIGGASALAVVLRSSRLQPRAFRWRPASVALVGLFCGAAVLAILAGPGAHPMYFAPVVAIGMLLAGRIYAVARSRLPRWLTAMLLLVSLLPAATAYQRYGAWVVRSTDPSQWTGIQTHRSAVRIARMLEQHGASGHVATLFPVVVIDANRVLPEFAAGPFFFRSADAYPAEQVMQLRGVGPDTLEALLAASPPAAIVAGFGPFRFNWNPPMDSALIDYARRSGFVRVADDWTVNGYRNGQVWIRPARP